MSGAELRALDRRLHGGRSISMESRKLMYGALFVWALTGVVAATVYGPGRNREVALQPVSETKAGPTTAVAATVPTSINWQGSFEEAMAKSRAEGKPVMVDFYTDWCGACKFLDKTIYTDQAVIGETANWISVKVNAEKRPDVAQSYGVTSYPTIAFLQSDGRPLDVQAGAPREGAYFVEWMRTAYSKWTPPARA